MFYFGRISIYRNVKIVQKVPIYPSPTSPNVNCKLSRYICQNQETNIGKLPQLQAYHQFFHCGPFSVPSSNPGHQTAFRSCWISISSFPSRKLTIADNLFLHFVRCSFEQFLYVARTCLERNAFNLLMGFVCSFSNNSCLPVNWLFW